MREAVRTVLLSFMLGLSDAMRRAGAPWAPPMSRRWTLRAPMDGALAHPERCWFWGESPLAN